MKRSFTKEEIKAIYFNALNGNTEDSRYNATLTLKDAVLSNFKGLFPYHGYGYHYEETTEEIIVPVSLNFIVGLASTEEDNGIFITINRTNPKGLEGYNDYVLEIEDLYEGDLYEITLEKFSELFNGKEFSEENAKLLK